MFGGYNHFLCCGQAGFCTFCISQVNCQQWLCARQCDSCDLSLISGARPPAKQTVLPLFFFVFFLHSNINFHIRNSIFNNYSNIYSNLEYSLTALIWILRKPWELYPVTKRKKNIPSDHIRQTNGSNVTASKLSLVFEYFGSVLIQTTMNNVL